MARTSSIMRRSGDSGHPYFDSGIKKAINISPLSMTFAIGFCRWHLSKGNFLSLLFLCLPTLYRPQGFCREIYLYSYEGRCGRVGFLIYDELHFPSCIQNSLFVTDFS